MTNHAYTSTAAASAPLFSVSAPTSAKAALPGWQQLDPRVRQPLVVLLTRMIQHHLPSPAASGGSEVADESP